MNMFTRRLNLRILKILTIVGSLSLGQSSLCAQASLSLSDSTTTSKTKELSSVQVVGQRWKRISRYAVLSTPLSTLDLQTTPAALGDILGGLQAIPSVQGNDADGRLIVAGGHPSETQTYIDGLLISHPNTLGMSNISVRNRFNPELFNDIALHSGGYSVANGHALSGIIDLKTQELRRNSNKTTIGINTTGLSLSQLLGRDSRQLYVKGSIIDMTPYGTLVKDSYEWRRHYNQQNINLLYSTQWKSWTLKIHGFTSLSGAKYNFETVDQSIRQQTLKEFYALYQTNMSTRISKHWNLSLGGNIVFWKFRGKDVLSRYDAVLTQDITSHSRIELQQLSQGAWNIRAGIDYLFQRYNQVYTLGGNYKMSYCKGVVSNYIDVQYLRNNLTANLGVRSEYNSLAQQISILPRLYIGWKNDRHFIALATGWYSQAASSDYLKFSNKLDNSTTWNNTLTYSFMSNSDKYSISVFYKKYSHLPTYKQNTTSSALWEYDTDGSGQMFGGSLLVKKTLGMLELWGSYSLTLGEIRNNAHIVPVPSPYASVHSSRMTLKYWIPKLKMLPAVSYHWDSGLSNIEGHRIPPRSRLDVSCSYLPNPRVVIHLSFLNLLGKQNYWGVETSSYDTSVYRYITNPSNSFLYIGAFITIGYSNKHNISPIRI